jgi:tRNA-dihydrouridine synthase B
MAGVTDRPYRDLCRDLGTHWAISEMLTSNQKLWHTQKSQQRLRFQDERGPRWIQVAGGDAEMVAAAAAGAAQLGADIVDINMGCPAKKVCNKAAGSAMLRDTKLVQEIFQAVIKNVTVPVTVKIRLGWSLDEINAPEVARIAEGEGIKLITVHGRSRACKFAGEVHYDEIAKVVQEVSIPVIANGDIRNEHDARQILTHTGAAAVMIGRAAQGRPWLPGQVDEFLKTGKLQKKPAAGEIKRILMTHVNGLADFYGEVMGPRIARKHVGWYLADPDNERTSELKAFNKLDTLAEQLQAIEAMFSAEGSGTHEAA